MALCIVFLTFSLCAQAQTGVWSGSSVSTVSTSNARLTNTDLLLRADPFHGIGWYGLGKLFATQNIDGPVVYGWNGGALGGNQNNNLKVVLRWFYDGRVTIGDVTTPGDYRLYVEKGILTEKIRVAVKTMVDWADVVFEPDYTLMPIRQLEQYINTNHHLPNVPAAEEVVKDGIDLQKMDAVLLRKVEELTLYVIQQQKEIDDLKKKINLKN